LFQVHNCKYLHKGGNKDDDDDDDDDNNNNYDYNKIRPMRNIKGKVVTSYNMGNCHLPKITRTTPEQHTGKARS
jgi:hypothetical protein